MMASRLVYGLVLWVAIVSHVDAGPVIVQKSSDPNKIDIFELKKELLQQIQWQEQVRADAHLQWIRQLPVGCIVARNGDYQCGLNWYRPYRYQQQQLYIELSEPKTSPRIEQ
ncbi:hypothetical protein ACVFI8_07115 [Agarivorans sp. MS3-6]